MVFLVFAAIARHVLGRELVGLFQKCHLFLIARLCILCGSHLLQLFHLGFQGLLFRVFLRWLVKIAEGPVDVIVGGNGWKTGFLPSAGFMQAAFLVIRIRWQLYASSGVLVRNAGEVSQRAHFFCLFALHVRLFVGSDLVSLYAGSPRVRQFGVEARIFLLLSSVLFRRCEDEPYRTKEEKEHSCKNQIFPDFQPLSQFVCIITHFLPDWID